MNDDTENLAKPPELAQPPSETAAPVSANAKFFCHPDWLSFWITTVLALAVYLWTIAPDVTLEMSGVISTAAKYGGVAHPPGFPVWTIYAWLFTKLLPFSNIAWRVAVSSAVAAAVTCGLIALMVSRGGLLIVEGVRNFKRLEPKNENQLRVVCGIAAGLGFGFDRCVWADAIIAETWCFGILMFATTLIILMKWFYAPERKGYLYLAFLVYGLTLSSHQLLFAAAFGVLVIVMCNDTKLLRDVSFGNSILFVVGMVGTWVGWLNSFGGYDNSLNLFRMTFIVIGVLSIGTCAWLTFRTRKFLTEWKTVLLMGAMFVLGLLPHVYLPIASMTTPPVNWGYARTPEGFVHLVTRGQFESTNPTHDIVRFFKQLPMLGNFAVHDFGLFYVLAVLVLFCFLRRMQSRDRNWILGLLAVYLSLSPLLLIVFNPPLDRQAMELVAPYFNASHLVLAIWAGYGLMFLGSILAREKIM